MTAPAADASAALDVHRIRSHFDFVRAGRVVTNNAATTQPPRELLEFYRGLVASYENVHRGQSSAARHTTAMFESSYDAIVTWLNAPSRRTIALYRNATEAHNAVMYALLTEFRDGDNVVTTMLEHNSNFVPWYALSREILPKFGRRVECRVARFDPITGRLDTDHLASLVDERTKLVCCTGASNFFGTKPDLRLVRAIADASGYPQPSGERRSLLLVDGAQLLPSSCVDVQDLDVDYLSFSFHKLLAPFGVGVLYAKEQLLRDSLPFLYGGEMIAEGQVSPEQVAYNELPWKYSAGTPNILGAIASAEALRLLVDLVAPGPQRYFDTATPLDRAAVEDTMDRIGRHTRVLTDRALRTLGQLDAVTVYGPTSAGRRAPVLAFNVAGMSPFDVADALDRHGVEARAGCHCATLAHRALGLDPPASCRLSFAVYNNADDVDRATHALARIARRAGRRRTGVPTWGFRSRGR